MKTFIRSYGPPLASAVLLAMAFPGWSLQPLAWLALVPLYVHARKLDPRLAAFAFLIAGFAAHAIVLRWVLVQVYWAGGWAVVGLLGLSLFFGLQWAFAGWLWRTLTREATAIWTALVFGLVWMTLEWIQNSAINVFSAPVSLANSQGFNVYVRQWASIGGVPLIGLFLALTSAHLASCFESGPNRWIHAAAGAVVVLVAHGGGFLLNGETRYAESPFVVGMFQSDFPVEMKHDPEYALDMIENAARKSSVLAENAELDLMVWPEALVMKQIDTRDVRTIIDGFVQPMGVPLFTGAARTGGEPPRAYNSAYMISPDGSMSEPYDKIQLAPFGEYIPLAGFLSFVPAIVPAIGQMGSGEAPVTFETGERTLGPLICFEVMFPGMSAELREMGADYLVVVTNLAWFGASNAIAHEFDIARMRAIETRMPLVHVGNTGITGIFDPFGRFTVVHSLVDRSGRLVPLNPDIDPRATVQHRLIDALPLPLPESPRVPWPPHQTAAAAPILLALLTGLHTLRKRRRFPNPGAAE